MAALSLSASPPQRLRWSEMGRARQNTKRVPRSDTEMAWVEGVGCGLVCVGVAAAALLSVFVGAVAGGLAASLAAAVGVGVIIANAAQ